ncbi:hypothetical protein HRG_012252 [Hirsutella rhossiliensis]
MDANRLQSLSSECERVVSEQTKTHQRSVLANQENVMIEPECPSHVQQVLPEAITWEKEMGRSGHFGMDTKSE